MSDPYYRDEQVTLYLGDALETLHALPDGSAHCVITSPPYYGLRDYGVDGQLGLEASPAEYVESLRAVFAEVRRVLAADGTLWLNIGDSYSQSGGHTDHGVTSQLQGRAVRAMQGVRNQIGDRPAKNMLGIPWRVAFALQDDGWILRNDVIWHKPNAMPESVTDRLSCRYEHVFMLTKARRYWFDLEPIKVPTTGLMPSNTAENRREYGDATGTDAGGRRFGGNPGSTLLERHETRNPGDVWTIPTQPFPGAHFATMPPALARRCILAGCPEGGTVLDPFVGSGTTPMVARQAGRYAVGIDLNAEFLDIAVDRIGQPALAFGAVS